MEVTDLESLRFLLDIALILLTAKVFGIIARKLHAPEVVGEIVAGLLIGPAVLGIVDQSDFISKTITFLNNKFIIKIRPFIINFYAIVEFYIGI